MNSRYLIEQALSDVSDVSDLLERRFLHLKIDVGLSFNAPMTMNWLHNEENLLVIGFEPSSSNFSSLKKLSGVIFTNSRIIIVEFGNSAAIFFNVGLSQKSYAKTLKFFETIHEPGGSSLYRPKHYPFKLQTKKITVWSLDDFLERFSQTTYRFISHLKIDTQGHDFEVIKGAELSLSQIMFVTCEMSVGNEYYVEEKQQLILDLLTIHGFQSYGYFSVRKSIGHFLRWKYVNILLEKFRKLKPEQISFRLDEVPASPSPLRRFLLPNSDWIKFTDRTFVNVSLKKSFPSDVFRIFQHG